MPRMTRIRSLVAFLLLGACALLSNGVCHAFVSHRTAARPVPNNRFHRGRSPAGSTDTRLCAIPPEILVDVEGSRVQFFGWFFGASGGMGIAVGAFPRMYEQFRALRALRGCEPSLGGETVGLSPLCGYPEDLCVRDLEKVVNNKLSIEQIVEKFPIENNFLSRNGYITFLAYERANKGNNPLVVRAVFDSFAQSTDACDPNVAQDKIDSYKEDVYQINGTLLQSKLVGYSAIGTLLFLLGLALSVMVGQLKNGWFPSWTLADGIFNIPDFWI
ncbi:unnamed protein product [Pseudo-nitzschia multistriata]|uniref:Uncharacterized protein n=1 Tax=Pseudo-nitzschia multistriata TaxID=183589 RepID=A0A448YWC0_9STRA|nr:unnamed protein product [Pseudo-nitzschia multistriata]